MLAIVNLTMTFVNKFTDKSINQSINQFISQMKDHDCVVQPFSVSDVYNIQQCYNCQHAINWFQILKCCMYFCVFVTVATLSLDILFFFLVKACGSYYSISNLFNQDHSCQQKKNKLSDSNCPTYLTRIQFLLAVNKSLIKS